MAATGAAWKVKVISTLVARQDTRGLVVAELLLDPVSPGLVPRPLARQEVCFGRGSILAGAPIIPALSASLCLDVDVTFWSEYRDRTDTNSSRRIIF